ncbi:putative exonuclease GOR [Zophobas morio]|uniref:putative exonuclease GOR n=1 Tax=Zophobas morio TaxID=2755281 RepID=UPI00308375A5
MAALKRVAKEESSKDRLLSIFQKEDQQREKLKKKKPLTPCDYDLSKRVFSFTNLLQPYALPKVQQFKCGFPCSMGKKVYFLLDNPWVKENPTPDDSAPGSKRLCTRCDRPFFTTQENYITEEGCIYHYGKIYAAQYTCCGLVPGSMGRTTFRVHVWSGVERGVNGPFTSFVTTRKSTYPDRNIYALDCEMCYTVAGLEVARVSVVGFDGVVVYDTFVRPAHSVERQEVAGLEIARVSVVGFNGIVVYDTLNGDRYIPDEGRGHSSCEDARTSLDLAKVKLWSTMGS